MKEIKWKIYYEEIKPTWRVLASPSPIQRKFIVLVDRIKSLLG